MIRRLTMEVFYAILALCGLPIVIFAFSVAVNIRQ